VDGRIKEEILLFPCDKIQLGQSGLGLSLIKRGGKEGKIKTNQKEGKRFRLPTMKKKNRSQILASQRKKWSSTGEGKRDQLKGGKTRGMRGQKTGEGGFGSA